MNRNFHASLQLNIEKSLQIALKQLRYALNNCYSCIVLFENQLLADIMKSVIKNMVRNRVKNAL